MREAWRGANLEDPFRLTQIAALTASVGEGNTAQIPSPVFLKIKPPRAVTPASRTRSWLKQSRLPGDPPAPTLHTRRQPVQPRSVARFFTGRDSAPLDPAIVEDPSQQRHQIETRIKP